MNNVTFHVSMEVWGAIFCIIGAVCIAAGLDGAGDFGKQPKRVAVMRILVITVLVVLSDAVSWMYYGDNTDVGRMIYALCIYCNFIFSFVLYIAVGEYTLCCIGVGKTHLWKKPAWCKAIYITALVGVVLVTLNLFHPIVYTLLEGNVFHTIPEGYLVVQALVLAGAGIQSVVVAVNYNKLSAEEMTGLLGHSITTFAVLPYQMFATKSEVVNLSMIVAALFLFTLYEMDQAKKGMYRKKELEESQMKLMMSQVQPHFIYNCLSALRFLVMEDQEKAYQAVNDFSRYLRMNLNTNKLNQMITLKEELENVECYYNLEKMQLGDELEIIYDLTDLDMMLPAMTIQPMVENAVKHGIKPKRGGLIRICQYEVKDSWQLLVEDDGVGFDMEKMYSDEREHIGVANVRKRIEQMCGGSLELMSKPDRGTQVYIIIPKNI